MIMPDKIVNDYEKADLEKIKQHLDWDRFFSDSGDDVDLLC